MLGHVQPEAKEIIHNTGFVFIETFHICSS